MRTANQDLACPCQSCSGPNERAIDARGGAGGGQRSGRLLLMLSKLLGPNFACCLLKRLGKSTSLLPSSMCDQIKIPISINRYIHKEFRGHCKNCLNDTPTIHMRTMILSLHQIIADSGMIEPIGRIISPCLNLLGHTSQGHAFSSSSLRDQPFQLLIVRALLQPDVHDFMKAHS